MFDSRSKNNTYVTTMAQHGFDGDIENIAEPQLAFIKTVIEQKGYKESKVTFKATGVVGDNYSANVKRIVIAGENGNLTLIAKFAPSNEELRKSLSTSILFANENFMYTKILPKLLHLQKQAEVPEADLLKFPKCYGSNTEAPNEVIVLEDFETSGFVMIDRLTPLSDEYVVSALKKLAAFHSTSYILKNKESDTCNYYKDNLHDVWGGLSKLSLKDRAYLQLIENITHNLIDNPEHKETIKQKIGDIVERAAKMTKFENGSRYAVIQHGDCWTNNVMFKFEDDVLKQSILIDYQVCQNSSPVNDILYLVLNCTDHETRAEHFYKWLDYYHSELDNALSNYGMKANYVYPKDQLDADVKRYAKLAFGVAILMSGVLILKPEEAGKIMQANQSTDPNAIVDVMEGLHEDTVARLKKRTNGLVDTLVTFGLL